MLEVFGSLSSSSALEYLSRGLLYAREKKKGSDEWASETQSRRDRITGNDDGKNHDGWLLPIADAYASRDESVDPPPAFGIA